MSCTGLDRRETMITDKWLFMYWQLCFLFFSSCLRSCKCNIRIAYW